MKMNLDHVGVVVKDLEKTAQRYNDMLGLKTWSKGIAEDQKNGVRLLSLVTGDSFIELVQPTKSTNRFGKFLKERGEGFFHLCLFIEDFDTRVKSLKAKGYTIEEEESNIDPEHKFRLAWIPPESPNGFWIELVDMKAVPEDLLMHKF